MPHPLSFYKSADVFPSPEQIDFLQLLQVLKPIRRKPHTGLFMSSSYYRRRRLILQRYFTNVLQSEGQSWSHRLGQHRWPHCASCGGSRTLRWAVLRQGTFCPHDYMFWQLKDLNPNIKSKLNCHSLGCWEVSALREGLYRRLQGSVAKSAPICCCTELTDLYLFGFLASWWGAELPKPCKCGLVPWGCLGHGGVPTMGCSIWASAMCSALGAVELQHVGFAHKHP